MPVIDRSLSCRYTVDAATNATRFVVSLAEVRFSIDFLIFHWFFIGFSKTIREISRRLALRRAIMAEKVTTAVRF